MVKDQAFDIDSVGEQDIQRFNISGVPAAVGTYKHVTASKPSDKAVNLEISGMLPLSEEGEVVGESVKEQTIVAITNIATAIQGAASHFEKELSLKEALQLVTSTMVLLDDMSNFSQVNEAYVQAHMPLACRAAFAAKELPLAAKGVKIEIRASAFLPMGEKTDKLIKKLNGKE